ncbi:MAG: MDR family oxidoreductase [Candidatus Symbiobacter sp.]|nr:MDR family oxidoreductase [Candidatus Symbiobacter sp.]
MKALYLTQNTAQNPPTTLAEIKELTDFPADVAPGDVTIKVTHSSLNYKDALAITGKGPIIRNFPMVPGIDLAGEVMASTSPKFAVGDKVLATSYGIGEIHWGGLATQARVKSDWVVKIPAQFTARQTMILGTAGFTAMLCVMALEKYGITPDQGDIAVTGAAGGVGSVAIHILQQKGFKVTAISGRHETEAAWLKAIGANHVIDRGPLSKLGKPLQREQWAAGIDTVGSHILANLLAATKYRGAVAACGLAQGGEMLGTVMPFILRNVALLGVDSVNTPMPIRQLAWDSLAKIMAPAILEKLVAKEIGLTDAVATAHDILAGRVRGRVVVATNG